MLESLLLESKLVFSDKFLLILNALKSDKVANELIKINQTDIDKLQHNYIDIDTKDDVTFISDRKSKDIIGDEEVLYTVVEEKAYLTNSKRNNKIFNLLGYTPEDRDSDAYSPASGTVGKIVSEAKSPWSNNIYVWFIALDPITKNFNKQTIMAKSALEPTNNEKLERLWKSNRNPIKIGRLARAILKKAKIAFTDKEVEEFVNKYKSYIEVTNNAFARFDIVKGDIIAHWYNANNYESDKGTLGKSCMSKSPESFFEIYITTEACSMLILYTKNGTIDNGKFKSDKISGRALVWNTNQGVIFLDRIYTCNDSDVSLFKEYAASKGWFYKDNQNSSKTFMVTNGTDRRSGRYTVTVSKGSYENYPYLDTLTFFNQATKMISNDAEFINTDGIANLRELTSTHGNAPFYDDWDDDDDDWDDI